MTNTTPTVAIARILRGLGLKQGHDFRVRGQYQGRGADRERIGTYVVVLSKQADQTVADRADEIERLSADAGHSFRVSIHFTTGGRMWTWVANYGQRTRDAAPVATADADGAPLDSSSRKRATDLGLKVATTAGTDQRAADFQGGTVPGHRRADTISQLAPASEQQAAAGVVDGLAAKLPKLKLGAPRPAFPLPDTETSGQLAQGAADISRHVAASVLDAHPYDGLTQKRVGALYWACEEAGQTWFFQDGRNTARYTLRVYKGRARMVGWYLSGPGVGEPGSDRYMGATMTLAAEASEAVILELKWIADRMEEAARAWPKGTRVQGVDSYGVTCMGTVNGVSWGVVTAPGHENYGRTWVDVDWDEMPHNRGTGRRNRPFTDDLIRH